MLKSCLIAGGITLAIIGIISLASVCAIFFTIVSYMFVIGVLFIAILLFVLAVRN